MKDSKKGFQELVRQMQPLQASEKGELKGGFQSISRTVALSEVGFNGVGYIYIKKKKDPDTAPQKAQDGRERNQPLF